jgi:hypothetical protein
MVWPRSKTSTLVDGASSRNRSTPHPHAPQPSIPRAWTLTDKRDSRSWPPTSTAITSGLRAACFDSMTEPQIIRWNRARPEAIAWYTAAGIDYAKRGGSAAAACEPTGAATGGRNEYARRFVVALPGAWRGRRRD